MAFDLLAFAQEFGIDPATLQAKPDSFSKWNGYLTEADGKYREATQAQRDADEKLARLKLENDAINEQIAKFGITESEVIALRANNAAMAAQLAQMKKDGLNVTIPDAPKPANQPAEFDPARFAQDVNATLAAGFNVTNRYLNLTGKALPDPIDVLAREAAQARQPFEQYVAQKYDFAGIEAKARAEQQKKHDEEIAAAAVKKYQEEHPATAGHPELVRGGASRHPQIVKPREATDQKKFANMGAREKIAVSVARTRAALQNQA
jgi:hypothetical protein